MAKTFDMSMVVSASLARDFGQTFKNASSTLLNFKGHLEQLQQRQQTVAKAIGLTENLQKQGKAYKEAALNAQALSAKLQAVKNPTAQLVQQQKSAVAEAQRLRQAWEQDSKALQELQKSADVAGKGLTALKAKQAMLSADAGITKMAGNLIGSGKDQVAQNAAYASIVGAGALNKIKGSVDVGKNFDTAVSDVGAVSGLKGEDLKELREQAKQLGSSTVWSATEAAQGQKYLATAGFKKNEILSAMPGMLSLASAAGTDLGRTADIASNILSGFKISADQMGKVGDVLVNTFTNSNTNLESLGETMKFVAPQAAALGVSLEETAAMAGKLGDAGIQGTMAGTALRTMMIRLSAPADKGAKALKDIGVATSDAKGNMRSMTDILTDLANKTEKMSQKQKTAYLKDIFGTEAISAAQVLMDQAQQGNLQSMTQNNKKEGTANEVAQAQTDNLEGSIKGLDSALEGLQITVYEKLSPILREVAEDATKVVGVISDWAKENPTTAKTITLVVSALAGLTAVGYPLQICFKSLAFLGGIMKVGMGGILLSVKNLAVGFNALKAAMIANPITIWITAITAAIAVGYLLYKNWDSIKAKAVELWNAFQTAFPGMAGIVKAYINPVIDIFKDVWDVLVGIKDFVVGVFTGDWDKAMNGIKNAGTAAWNVVKDTLGAPFKIFGGILDTLDEKTGVVTRFKETLSGVGQYLTQELPKDFPETANSLKNLIGGISSIGVDFETAKEGLEQFGASLLNGDWSGAWDGLKTAGESAWQGIDKALHIPQEAMKTLFTFIEEKTGIFSKLQQIAIELWNTFSEKFPGIAGFVKDAFGTFKSVIDGAKASFEAILNFVKTGFTEGWNKAWEGLKSAFTGIFSGLKGVVLAPVVGVINAVNSIIEKINSIKGHVPDWIAKWIPDMPQLPVPALASGGIATNPTMAMVGEAGDEAIVPLSKIGEFLKNAQEFTSSQTPASMPQINITINVANDGSTPDQIRNGARQAFEQLQSQLRDFYRRERAVSY